MCVNRNWWPAVLHLAFDKVMSLSLITGRPILCTHCKLTISTKVNVVNIGEDYETGRSVCHSGCVCVYTMTHRHLYISYTNRHQDWQDILMSARLISCSCSCRCIVVVVCGAVVVGIDVGIVVLVVVVVMFILHMPEIGTLMSAF